MVFHLSQGLFIHSTGSLLAFRDQNGLPLINFVHLNFGSSSIKSMAVVLRYLKEAKVGAPVQPARRGWFQCCMGVPR